jgi:DNA-binding GntR family transcriptional regulator
MINANGRFHDYIYELCSNKNLLQIIKQLQARCHLIRYHAWSSPEVIQDIQSEHQEIIGALGKKDFDNLKELSVRHISYSKDSYLTHLRAKRANMLDQGRPTRP